MPDEKLKSDHAKEKHGELMIAVAASIFIAVFSELLGPVTLSVVNNAYQPNFGLHLGILGVCGIAAISLMNKGLKRIDRTRINREPLIFLPKPSIEIMSDGGSDLNIAINHGNTQITIRLK